MNHVSALFTDFYELTMAQGYWKQGMNYPVVFDMFFRRHPFRGGFSVFAGLGTLLDSITGFSFSDGDIAYLDGLGGFAPDFLDYLKGFRFTGDLYSVDEGSLIFPNEPLLRVHANLIEAQIIEGLILNHLNFQSLVATKSARVWLASRKGAIMEFGLRRAQGPDGALSASRAALIGGAAGTSNTLAGKLFHIPVMGTMAHSWVMSFPGELEAFRAYAALYPERTVFLIDTYDTLQSGIKNAITAGGELVAKGHNFAVRLDSGDIMYLSKKVRRLLDDAGFPKAGITVSNELDEEIIEALVLDGAPITSWGVGTHLVTGGRDSSFTGVYKLAAQKCGGAAGEYKPVMKFSDNPEKMTNPGVKDLWRLYNDAGSMEADIVALEGETLDVNKETVFYHPAVDYRRFAAHPARVERLLKQRLAAGTPPAKRDPPDAELRCARSVMEAQLSLLDDTYKRFLNPHIYKVSLTRALKDMKLGFLEKKRKG